MAWTLLLIAPTVPQWLEAFAGHIHRRRGARLSPPKVPTLGADFLEFSTGPLITLGMILGRFLNERTSVTSCFFLGSLFSLDSATFLPSKINFDSFSLVFLTEAKPSALFASFLISNLEF